MDRNYISVMVIFVKRLPMIRKFISWQSPFLEQVAKEEFELAISLGSNSEKIIDFSNTIYIVSTKRSLRKLSESFVLQAHTLGYTLVPPQILTLTTFFNNLILGNVITNFEETKIVDELTAKTVWAQILKDSNKDVKKTIFGESALLNSPRALYELAEEIYNLSLEFLSLGKSITDYSNTLLQSETYSALTELEEEFERRIESEGLISLNSALKEILDKDTISINNQSELYTNIIFLGVTRIPLAVKKLIEKLRAEKSHYIYADQSYEEYFDQLGCIDIQKWSSAKINTNKKEVFNLVEDYFQLKTKVVDKVANSGQKYSIDEVSLAVCNDELIPWLSHELKDKGVATTYGLGHKVTSTESCRLLQLINEYLKERNFSILADILRLPTFHKYINFQLKEASLNYLRLKELDLFFEKNLTYKITKNLKDVRLNFIDEYLINKFNGVKNIANEIKKIFDIKKYSAFEEQDYIQYYSCTKIIDFLNFHASFFDKFELFKDEREKLEVVLYLLQSEEFPEFPENEALQITGWLDLPYLSTKSAIVCGFESNNIPDKIKTDRFLPNSLRKELDLEDNDYRVARDCYFLKTVLESKDDIKILISKYQFEGNAVFPSLLYFKCEEDEVIDRLKSYIALESDKKKQESNTDNNIDRKIIYDFKELSTQIIEQIDVANMQLSITGLNDYLKCPFRFFLKNILKLKISDDSDKELGFDQIGSIIHEVFEKDSNQNRYSNVKEEILLKELYSVLESIKSRYSESYLPSVEINFLGIKEILKLYPDFQREREKAGWVNVYKEREFISKLNNVVIKGRIDRIDYNPKSKIVSLIDFKTGSADKALKLRKRNGEWINLQLPLYYKLFIDNLSNLDLFNDKEIVGYELALVTFKDKINYSVANLKDDDITSAIVKAEEIISKISAKEFLPPSSLNEQYDDFKGLVSLVGGV